ncbi:hypothetical protein D3C76_1836380 [compost metagenome]
MAQGVLDGQRVAQVMFQGNGADVGAGFVEVAADQAVVIVAVSAVGRLVWIGRRTIGRTAGFEAVGDA